MKKRIAVSIFAILALPQSALSNEPIPDVTITRSQAYSIGGSYSEHDAYAFNAAATIPFGKRAGVDFNLGYCRSPPDLADLTTYRGGVGFDYDFNPVGVSIGYEHWGDRDFITTQTVKSSIYVHGEHGRLAALAEFRDIDLEFDVPAGARGFVASSKSGRSEGYGASARYTGKVVDVYASGASYDYNFKVGRLSSIIDLSRVPVGLRAAVIQRLDSLVFILRRLNASSVTLTSNFVDYTLSAGTDIRFGERTLNLDLTRDKSATDGAILQGVSLGFTHPLGDHFDIEYRVGLSDDDILGTSAYGGMMFYWYR